MKADTLELRVKVVDEATGEVLSVAAALGEVLPLPENRETYDIVRAELLAGGVSLVGGGAAPAFRLTVAGI